jgi:hypothetical protein
MLLCGEFVLQWYPKTLLHFDRERKLFELNMTNRGEKLRIVLDVSPRLNADATVLRLFFNIVEI